MDRRNNKESENDKMNNGNNKVNSKKYMTHLLKLGDKTLNKII